MITIKINAEKLREAAFKYQQKLAKEIANRQNAIIDEYLSGFFLFKKPTRYEAAAWLDKNMRGEWPMLHAKMKQDMEQYKMIRTACNLSEDGIVQIDAKTAYRIFGDVQ